MSTYFRAVRPDGTDFRTGTIDYAAALGGDPITLPVVPRPRCCTSDVLHASIVPTETLGGGSWPCRLFEVTGTPVAEKGYERGFFSLTVVREVDAHQALGPQGEQIAALIDRAGKLTVDEAEKLAAAWDAASARPAAWDAAWAAAWDAASARNAARDAAWAAVRDAASARDAAWDAAWAAAWDAALALVVRDLITKEHYDLLTGPWAQVVGPAHPDDPTRTTDPSQPRRFDSLADIPEDMERAAGKYQSYPCELARSPLSGTGWMMRVDHPYALQQWVEYMGLDEDNLTDIEEVIDHE